MRMDKLTSKFQMALADAQSLPVGRDHQFIEPVHLMVTLLDQEGGTARHLLTRAGAKVDRLRSQLGEQLDRLRALAKGELKPQFERLVASCEKLLKSPPPTAEPPKKKLTNLQKISMIQGVIEDEVKPQLRKDGGDIELVDIDALLLGRLGQGIVDLASLLGAPGHRGDEQRDF